jgi:indolepyruvate ferredoxin oxidoreductase beta subunit
MALELGDPILLNMIMLGALCGFSAFPLAIKDFKSALEQVFPAPKLEINYELDMGVKLISEYEN